MNFKKFKESLKYKKYSKNKILVRFIEYKFKNLIIDLIINFNLFRFNSKPLIDLGSFSDNRFINYLLYSLKKDFTFVYKKDENTKKLFKRIGFLNFFKHTLPNTYNKKKIKFLFTINKENNDINEVNFDTNYFKYISNQKDISSDKHLIMPYYMYPRIYNSFYKKIKILSKPDFNLRIFFSGSIVEEGYNSFVWDEQREKFPNRIEVIKKILKEFEKEIFLIKNKDDLRKTEIFKKKIIFCLHDKMVKKTSYILNFENNFKFLSKSCFNLSCPGVVMPLSHHLIEGIKVGSIPITNCDELLNPNLNKKNSLQYSSLEDLLVKIKKALEMENDEILFMRQNVLDYYKSYLSPEYFAQNFKKLILKNEKRIICCDDHRSVNKLLHNAN